MKRKELEDVNHYFSDFSLSSPSPPIKIRRLDAELILPPIMEEEELEIPPIYEQQQQQRMPTNLGPVIEELPTVSENEERAIVLFKPIINTHMLQSPSGFSISVNPELIAGFKNQVLWSSNTTALKSTVEEVKQEGKNSGATNNILAVVPWVSCQPPTTTKAEVPQRDTPMEDEEMEAEVAAAAMDVENKYVGVEQRPGNESSDVNGGLHQWQQQYCMIPQPPQNTSASLVWYR